MLCEAKLSRDLTRIMGHALWARLRNLYYCIVYVKLWVNNLSHALYAYFYFDFHKMPCNNNMIWNDRPEILLFQYWSVSRAVPPLELAHFNQISNKPQFFPIPELRNNSSNNNIPIDFTYFQIINAVILDSQSSLAKCHCLHSDVVLLAPKILTVIWT